MMKWNWGWRNHSIEFVRQHNEEWA
jgi:hypothetical protein